ncbi:hypothetical protein NHX12_009289 [Muraenolepis orangiensis]|uniref:Uncharacterized protein n=1 Tax=Muraenolepis orangiensis TaxID=630683 RepID=A0A9Q0DN12_9TELE|nr:hypothetical protein NHX12_009289 [Muraenolepis orangiensis]
MSSRLVTSDSMQTSSMETATQQLALHKWFQAEMFSRQQILHSIISDGPRMLEQGQGSSILTVEAGRQLLLSADSRTEVGLQGALTQDGWGQANASQDVHKRELEGRNLA